MKRFLLLPFLFGFHQPASFEASVNDGGGHRMYFDGSPRGKSYDCSTCHTDGAKAITARVDGLAGAYTPGMTYTVMVALDGEHAGFGTANNQNGFVAELVDDAQVPAGTLVAPDDAVELVDDGNVISGEGKERVMWSFQWTAPAAGTGAVTLHLSMVDGNGAQSAQLPQNDPSGDDTATLARLLCEGSAGCSEPTPPSLTDSKAAGCNASGGGSLVLAALALLGLLLRRRAGVLVLFTGCFTATSPEDCPDKVCSAAFPDAGPTEPPPDLDLEFFKCRVQPIFQRGCGQLACHGTDTGRQFVVYSRGRWRNNELVPNRGSCAEPAGFQYNLQTDGSGTVMCAGWYPHTDAEFQKNYDSARAFMAGVDKPADSLLLREPAKGGLPHAQVKLFSSTDADYQTIASWLGGATLGTTCNTGAN